MSSNKQPGLPTEVSYNEAVEASKKYFDGDDLAATVWVSKYALKDSYGHIYEKTPRDMHERIAAEIERIEKKYPNPMNRQEVFELLDHFRYIIPQGGPMTGIGNNFQAASLSNCFLHDYPTSSHIHDDGFRFHHPEFFLADKAGCALIVRSVHGNDIGLAHKVLKRDRRILFGMVCSGSGVIDDFHPKRGSDSGNF